MSKTPESEMQVVVQDLDDIRPYHRNPQEHPDEQIDELKDSIRQFGFRQPIIVDDDGEIISGHGRYKAVQELADELDAEIDDAESRGRTALAANLRRINDGQIHTQIERELSAEEKQEYRISDNKVSELSDWEDEKLKFELREIEDAVGFDDEELDQMLETDVDYDELEEDVVDDTKSEMEDHIKDLASDDDTTMVELICPSCADGYEVRADDLQKKVDRSR